MDKIEKKIKKDLVFWNKRLLITSDLDKQFAKGLIRGLEIIRDKILFIKLDNLKIKQKGK